jgi:hypothetical protein
VAIDAPFGWPVPFLRQWAFDPRGYKGPKPEKVEKRHQLVSEATYANLSRDQRELLMASDHLFDAFVSTLVGRAVELGRTLPIPNQARASAVRKGWIHLPERQPLSQFRPH